MRSLIFSRFKHAIIVALLIGLVFPLVPSVKSSDPPSQTDIYATADSWTDEANPDVNHGTDTLLEIASPSGKRAYFMFNLTDVFDGWKSIIQIRLNLLLQEETDACDIKCYTVSDDSWTESGITWNNQPTLGELQGSVSVSPLFVPYPIYYDVTFNARFDYYQNDMLLSFALKTDDSETAKVKSKEYGSNPPYLHVNYVDCDPITDEIASEWTLDGSITKSGVAYPPTTVSSIETSGTRGKIGQTKNGDYFLFRSFLSFGTGELPDLADVSSATLNLRMSMKEIVDIGVGWNYPNLTIWSSTGWTQFSADIWGANQTLMDEINLTNWNVETWNAFTIPTDEINSTASTQFELMTDREGSEENPLSDEYCAIYLGESTPNDPYLEVTYTIPPSQKFVETPLSDFFLDNQEGYDIEGGTWNDETYTLSFLSYGDVYITVGDYGRPNRVYVGGTLFEWTYDVEGDGKLHLENLPYLSVSIEWISATQDEPTSGTGVDRPTPYQKAQENIETVIETISRIPYIGLWIVAAGVILIMLGGFFGARPYYRSRRSPRGIEARKSKTRLPPTKSKRPSYTRKLPDRSKLTGKFK